MISRERVLTALAVQQPDRVPFMEAGIDWEMQVKIMGREDFTPAELAAELGLDGITVDFLPPLFVETGQTSAHEFIEWPFLASPDDLSCMKFPDPTDPAFYDEAKWLVNANRGQFAVGARIRLGRVAHADEHGLRGLFLRFARLPGFGGNHPRALHQLDDPGGRAAAQGGGGLRLVSR